MSEIQKLHQLIAEALEEIRNIKNILNGTEKEPETQNKLVNIQHICNDLGISRSQFDKKFKSQMPFLFQLKSNGKMYARLSDYEDWKQRLVKKFQTIKENL